MCTFTMHGGDASVKCGHPGHGDVMFITGHLIIIMFTYFIMLLRVVAFSVLMPRSKSKVKLEMRSSRVWYSRTLTPSCDTMTIIMIIIILWALRIKLSAHRLV